MKYTSNFVQPMMDKDDVAAMIIQAKKAKGLTWQAIADTIGMAPVWTHAACTGMCSMPIEKAKVLCEALELPEEAPEVMAESPMKVWDQTVPTDPCVYRLYEIMGVYGPSIKAMINEEFGDGIMSAIDYDVDISRVEDPKGDRVKIEMTGKYLVYKTF